MRELLRVRVQTESAADSIQLVKGILYIRVVDAPARNLANRKVIALVRKYTKAKRVELVSGHHKTAKVLRVT